MVIRNGVENTENEKTPKISSLTANYGVTEAEEGRRRRRSSLAIDLEKKVLEAEFFNLCKKNITDTKANSGLLLMELHKHGILYDDTRLSPLIYNLVEIKNQNKGKIFSINNINLDFGEFCKVVQQCLVLISTAFKGQLVIPEFEGFCEDITNIYNRCKSNDSGSPAAYIPQLARGDPTKWGVSLCTVDGQRFSVGDVEDYFTIQSTSKPFTYAICLDHLGPDVVQEYIGREPSGKCFNEIALDHNGLPHNPMVNSGAIMSAALLLHKVKPELATSEKFEFVHNYFSRLSGMSKTGSQTSVFLSERENADRNHALAYFMREMGCFPESVDIKNILDFYFQMCSLEMNCESMAVMAGTLANGGICPTTGERVLTTEAVRRVLSLMYSCGMYNFSGQFAYEVGLPAKSGVSGVVLVVVPNVVGFATWSPPLDSIGNSARGVMFAEELVKVFDFHTFNSMSSKKNPRNECYEEKSISTVKLLFAASYGDKQALERAYLSGLDMNMGDYDNRTALHLACSEDHLASVKFLAETCKVDLNVQDRWGNTPLQEAQRFNRTNIVAFLKKHMIVNKPVDELSLVEIDETCLTENGAEEFKNLEINLKTKENGLPDTISLLEKMAPATKQRS